MTRYHLDSQNKVCLNRSCNGLTRGRLPIAVPAPRPCSANPLHSLSPAGSSLGKGGRPTLLFIAFRILLLLYPEKGEFVNTYCIGFPEMAKKCKPQKLSKETNYALCKRNINAICTIFRLAFLRPCGILTVQRGDTNDLGNQGS